MPRIVTEPDLLEKSAFHVLARFCFPEYDEVKIRSLTLQEIHEKVSRGILYFHYLKANDLFLKSFWYFHMYAVNVLTITFSLQD